MIIEIRYNKKQIFKKIKLVSKYTDLKFRIKLWKKFYFERIIFQQSNSHNPSIPLFRNKY